MRGIDFKGNTSSADAKLPSSERWTDGFSDVFPDGFSGDFSAAVDFLIGISIKANDVDISKSTCPKDYSRIFSREEISVCARVILILPRPSQ